MTTTELADPDPTEPDDTGGEATPTSLPPASTPGIDKVYATALEAFWRANAKANAAMRERRPLRKMVDLVPLGVYDGWTCGQGEPKEIPDMDKVEELLAKHGYEVPKTLSAPSLVVVPPAGFRP